MSIYLILKKYYVVPNITFYNTTLEKNLQVIFNIFYRIFALSEDMTEAREKVKI